MTTVAKALVKVKRPRTIPLSEYLPKGQYPIIDQGKGGIAGFTDDESAVIFSPLPITIFGDHTRIVKLSKVPFAAGADGTQLLYPIPGIDPTFFYYAIKNIDLSNYFYARHFKFLKACEFPVPPSPVQRRIANILSAYDDLIENNRKRIALLEESARQLYKEWFVHLRFPGHERHPVEDGVPKGWKRTMVGELCASIRDAVNPKRIEEGTPYIGLEHMPRRSITLSEWGTADDVASGKLRFKEGQILFGKIRPYFHKVGIAFMDGVASSDAIVIRPNAEELLPFVLLAVSSDAFIAATAQGMREGSKMPRADWKQMQQYPLLLPPKDTLASFNEIVFPVLRQCATLALQSRALAAARDALLPRLMKGDN